MDRLTQEINDTFTAMKLDPEQRTALWLLIALVAQAVREGREVKERKAA